MTFRIRPALWLIIAAIVTFWLFIGLVGTISIANVGGPVAVWATCIVAVAILFMLAGTEINGHWLGILIDNRNKYSLARLQISLWTVMVMSAYLIMALRRILAMGPNGLTQDQALDITFPPELLLAMGISAASFAGSTLIKQTKSTKTMTIVEKSTPEDAEKRRDEAKKALDAANEDLAQKATDTHDAKQKVDAAQASLDSAAEADKPARMNDLQKMQSIYKVEQEEEAEAKKDSDLKTKELKDAEQDLAAITEAQGRLHRNADPSEASWVDLFRGEEISNYKLVDMSKVQMMFFTIVVISVYGAGITALLRGNLVDAKGLSFPPFGDTLNALLGISHGTYLSVKAVDHS